MIRKMYQTKPQMFWYLTILLPPSENEGMSECPLKRDHFKRKGTSLPTSIFQGILHPWKLILTLENPSFSVRNYIFIYSWWIFQQSSCVVFRGGGISATVAGSTEVGPAAIPAILYALARRPKYRMAAGSALAMLGVLAVWPMHMERPYRTGGTAMVSCLEQVLFEESCGLPTEN